MNPVMLVVITAGIFLLAFFYKRWEVRKTTEKDNAHNLAHVRGSWMLYGWDHIYLKCARCGTCIGHGGKLHCKCDEKK